MQAKIAAISEVVSSLIQGIKAGEDIDLNVIKKEVISLCHDIHDNNLFLHCQAASTPIMSFPM